MFRNKRRGGGTAGMPYRPPRRKNVKVTKRIVMKVKVTEKRGNTGGRKNEKEKNSHFSLMKCNRVWESTVDLSSSN